MARTSVSISDDLRRRMDAVSDEGVNWSALAVQAFEAKLAEIITSRGAKDMKEVVARLKASRAKTDHADKVAGREAGAEWAKTTAEAVELERLAELVEGNDWDTMITPGYSDAYAPQDRILFFIQPESDGDRNASRSFWEHVAGSDVRVTPEFLDGFGNGAVDVWNAVRPEVDGGPSPHIEHVESIEDVLSLTPGARALLDEYRKRDGEDLKAELRSLLKKLPGQLGALKDDVKDEL